MKKSEESVELFVRSISKEPEDIELYRYALLRIKSIFVWVALIITVCCVSGNMKNTLIIVFSIMPIRKYAGGMHLKSERACYVASSIMLIIAVKVVACSFINTNVLIVLFFISVTLICITGSVGNDYRALTRDEKKIYGRKARFFCLIELLMVVALFYIELYEYGRCICIGGTICAILQAIEVYS